LPDGYWIITARLLKQAFRSYFPTAWTHGESGVDKTRQLILKLETLQALPTLPSIIQRLQAEVRDPRSDAQSVATIIGNDPAMMARILKVVNSAFYGAREPISSLQLAVARLGMNAVSNIALSTTLFATLSPLESVTFNRKEFWRHCVMTGLATELVAAKSRQRLSSKYNRDLLHVCGLLHDIGKIILDAYMRDEFRAAVVCARERRIPLIQAEQKIFGSDHTQLGSWLGVKWNLPRNMLNTVRWHHDPMSAEEEYVELTTLCCVANGICNTQHLGESGDTAAAETNEAAVKYLGLDETIIAEIATQTMAYSKESEVLMSILA